MKENKRKISSLTFKERTSIAGFIVLIIFFFLFLIKFIASLCLNDYFLLVNSIFTFFLFLGKSLYFIGERHCKSEKDKPIYVLFMGIMLFFGSLAFLIYWALSFYKKTILDYSLIKVIFYCVLSFVEVSLSIIGIFYSRKHKDILLYGYKCLNLGIAFTSIAFFMISIFAYFELNAIYGINFLSIIVSFYLIIYSLFKIKRFSKLD